MANNNSNNNSSGTKKGKGILTTFGSELSNPNLQNDGIVHAIINRFRYHNLPPEEIARRQKVADKYHQKYLPEHEIMYENENLSADEIALRKEEAKKLAGLDMARHLSTRELGYFLNTLRDVSRSVRDTDMEGINKYNSMLDSVAKHTSVIWYTNPNYNAPNLTYDKDKIDIAKLKSVIRVWKLEDVMRMVDSSPYIEKSLMLIGNAYNRYVTIGSSIKSYVRSKNNMNISLYKINKWVVLPEIVDPLLQSFYEEFDDKLNKSLYERTEMLEDDWYEGCR